jgi:hypothetical protein
MGVKHRGSLSHAVDIHCLDSRLSAGNITTLASQLPLLSNLFGLCA